MTIIGLPVARLVKVSVNLAPNASRAPSLNSLLLLGTSTVIDVVQRMRSYADLSDVAADFGNNCEEYFAAQAWFGQSPQPNGLLIGRWAKTAAAGQLVGGVLSGAHQLASFWQGIADGSFTVHADGGGAKNLAGLDFTLAANLNAVATIINTAMAALPVGLSIAWRASTGQFVMTSATTGAASSVSFLTPEGAGTDISASLGLTAAVGAYQANGIVAETAVAAVALFDNQFSTQWYGLVMPAAVDADHEAVAAYVEGAAVKHFYGVSSQEAAILSSASTTDIAAMLQAAGYNRSATQYSSTSAYAISSFLARILTTDWTAQNSAITLMYKAEPGIVAEDLTTSQADVVQLKNCNVYATYNNGDAIIQNGVCASGLFVDAVVGVDWLQAQIQTNVYNVLKQTPTKVPQTDGGMHQLATAIAAACDQGVTNGLIGKGLTWNFAGVGQVAQGDILPKGYYIYTPPIASQAPNDRSARKSVTFQVIVTLAGAVHNAIISVTVSQ
jgi:hypothetical protein